MKKLRRQVAKGAAARAETPHQGPCFKKGCKQNGGTIHTCITCEKLASSTSQGGEVFQVQCCTVHYHDGLKKVRRHAITAHPANLLRVVAAGLRGEEI